MNLKIIVAILAIIPNVAFASIFYETNAYQNYKPPSNQIVKPQQKQYLPSGLRRLRPSFLDPIQSFNSPNYEIQILTEDKNKNTNRDWLKYSKFFDTPTKPHSQIPIVKVNYDVVKNISQEKPQLTQTADIDSILKALYGKNHIVVLNQKHCNRPKPTQEPPKRFKQLHNLSHNDIDKIVDNILKFLDTEEDKKLPLPCRRGATTKVSQSDCGCSVHRYARNCDQSKLKHKRNCKDSYLFYLANENNSLHDILMRIMPIAGNIFKFNKN